MRKFKYALFVILAFVICAFCLAACSGEKQPSAANGAQGGTTAVEPNSPNIPQKPDENNDGNIEPEQPNKDPDEGSENEEPKQPDEETPEKPKEPVDPEKPVEPVNPVAPVDPVDPVDPVIPDDPTEPEEPSITALEEGVMTNVEKAYAEYSFIAQTSAYYVVKVDGQSADGALKINEEIVAANGEDNFYLYGVYLEKDEELKLTVAVSGGEIGVFTAVQIYTSTDEDYSAVSDETQKYFVYVAEYDGVCNILLQYEGEDLSIGACYIDNGIVCPEEPDDICIFYDCTLKRGDIVVIWVEKADVGISVDM